MVPEDWLDDAACASDNPDIFFPEDYRTSGVLEEDDDEEPLDEEQLRTRATEVERRAKGICMGCPVRMDCLMHALESDERYGIYGGANARDRRRIASSQRKAS